MVEKKTKNAEKKKPKEKGDNKKIKKSNKSKIKLFDKWSLDDITVKDPGLVPYINLEPIIFPKSAGIHQSNRLHKGKIHIVERLALKLMGAGHSGKKHKISSGRNGGGFIKCLKIVEDAFDKIEEKTKKNPIEIFVRAIENAAPKEEVTSYQVGSIMARSAVITAPQRRIDKALRSIAQGSYRKSFNSKEKSSQILANELIFASKNDDKSHSINEKNRVEGEAEGSR